MADFLSLAAQIPDLATAGNALAAQLHAEGAAQGLSAATIQDRVGTAQLALAGTYENLVDSSHGFQISPEGAGGAIDIAQQAVSAAHTTLGAVQSIGSMLDAASSGSPEAITQTGNVIVGTLITAFVAAGALSAGVGAVIGAGIGIAFSVLQSSGLLGEAPKAMVNGSALNVVPTMVVGGAWSATAPQIGPGSPLWRHFPEKTNAPDAGWYAVPKSTGSTMLSAIYVPKTFSWRGDDWHGTFTNRPTALIDLAFPGFSDLAAEQGSGALADFKRAFFVAWKANRAFALNGLKPQDDYAVLLQVLRTWNASHSLGSPILLGPNDFSKGANYEAVLAGDAVRLSGADPNIVSGKLRIATGPLLPAVVATPQKIVKILLIHHPAAPPPAALAWADTTTGVTARDADVRAQLAALLAAKSAPAPARAPNRTGATLLLAGAGLAALAAAKRFL